MVLKVEWHLFESKRFHQKKWKGTIYWILRKCMCGWSCAPLDNHTPFCHHNIFFSLYLFFPLLRIKVHPIISTLETLFIAQWVAKEDNAFIGNYGFLWIWWPQSVFFSILRKANQIVLQFFPFFTSFEGLENSGSRPKITIWPRFT